MGCARRGELRIRVDYATETISFTDLPFVRSAKSAVSSPSSPSLYDTIQPSLAELVRTHLSTLAMALYNAVRVIDRPRAGAPPINKSRPSPPSSPKLVAAANAERRALSLHKALIARTQLLSELSVRKEKEKEEPSCRTELRRAKLIEEQKEQDDAKKKEIDHARREIESIRMVEIKT